MPGCTTSSFTYTTAAKTSCVLQQGSCILNASFPAHLLRAALVGVLLLLLLLKSLLPFAAQSGAAAVRIVHLTVDIRDDQDTKAASLSLVQEV
jgi:hypothetical protein